MLAATAKIGSKYLVNIDILKALGAELEQLPEKEKVMFDDVKDMGIGEIVNRLFNGLLMNRLFKY